MKITFRDRRVVFVDLEASGLGPDVQRLHKIARAIVDPPFRACLGS